ncbi:TetR/AcrR family transcriptional regulator [Brachybacterium sp. DNPG3]
MTDLFDPMPEAPGTRRKENTRTRLVRASLNVFVEKGLDGATVDDLTKAAGFTRGAFYSNFSDKEEVFIELFSAVTAELREKVREAAQRAIPLANPCAPLDDYDDAIVLVAVFEAIRPYGRQWYLLYSEAVTHSLRDETYRAELIVQRSLMRDEIGRLIELGLEISPYRLAVPTEDLAQLIVGIFTDLLLREHLDGRDITELASVMILRTVHAFLTLPSEPGEPARATDLGALEG